MDEDKYNDLIEKVNSGKLQLGIDRAVARQFYMDIPISKVENETGEAPYFQKMLVWFMFLASWSTLLISIILSIVVWQWWSLIVICSSFVVYSLNISISSLPHSRFRGLSILLTLAIGTLFADIFSSPFISWYLVAVFFSLWAYRVVYLVAVGLLREFVLRNHRAFEFMQDYIDLREPKC